MTRTKVDVSRCERLECWPSGSLVVGHDGSYFVPAGLSGQREGLTASLARRILEFAPSADAAATSFVWARAFGSVSAQRAGKVVDQPKGKKKRNLRTWASVEKELPRGSFLSEGAFKRVYRVGTEAVSVADLAALKDDLQEAESKFIFES